MKFLTDLFRRKLKIGPYFGSTVDEIDNFFCEIGESVFLKNSIKIMDYPFEPSSIYPEKEIESFEINEIQLNEIPPTIKVGSELIFISRDKFEELTDFAQRNYIETIEYRHSNWDRITEPFVDTEFDHEQKLRTIEHLKESGFSEVEIAKLREEIGGQMYKFNFDTMLWDWCNLGLKDVLSAMRVKLNSEEFKEFYWRAMEIEQRK